MKKFKLGDLVALSTWGTSELGRSLAGQLQFGIVVEEHVSLPSNITWHVVLTTTGDNDPRLWTYKQKELTLIARCKD